MSKLPDVQGDNDPRGIDLQWVGIEGVETPILVYNYNNEKPVTTLAQVNLFASLKGNQRGAHMSRFLTTIYNNAYNVEQSESWKFSYLYEFLNVCLGETISGQSTNQAYISTEFKYPVKVIAPRSRAQSWTFPYIKFEAVSKLASISKEEIGTYSIIFRVTFSLYVTTCCPCSKELCDKGAHNQRALVTLRLVTNQGENIPPFEDIFEEIARAGSSPIFNILKRNDEKHITDYMYRNAKFVEDVVRDLAGSCKKKFTEHIIAWDIKVSSEESIHTHNATAYMKHGSIHI